MKKSIVIILMSMLIFFIQNLHATVDPTGTDTIYYKHYARACTDDGIYLMIIFYQDGDVVGNSGSYSLANANDPAFTGWPKCNSGNLCNICSLETNLLATFNLDERPDSIWFHLDKPSGSSPDCSISGATEIDIGTKYNFGNSCNYFQCQLNLWRTNHVSINHKTDYCGNDNITFDNIIFFQQTEYLVINAYINNGTTFTNIGSYVVSPSKTTPYSTSADILLSQFTSNYAAYLGNNIYFDCYYASNESGTSTSATSKIDNIFAGYQLQSINKDILPPVCVGQKGSLRINSVVPNSPISLNYTIKPVCTYCGVPVTGILNISDLATSPYIINNLAVGSYTVVFWAQDYCMYTTSIDIPDVSNPVTLLTPTITQVTCFNSSTGTIQLNPSGGKQFSVAPVYNSILKNSSGATMSASNYFYYSNLPPDTYTATITDANNCTTSAYYTLSNGKNPAIHLSSVTQPACFNNQGTIIVGIDNANPGNGSPYYYILNTNTPVSSSDTFHSFSPLDKGTYTMYAKDKYGCASGQISKTLKYTSNFQINNPLSVSQAGQIGGITYNLQCTNGSSATIKATPSGNLGTVSYNWYDNANNSLGTGNPLTVQSNGKYYVIGTDGANNCKDTSDKIEVKAPVNQLVLNIDTNNYHGYAIRCNGYSDTIKATANGGIGYYRYFITDIDSGSFKADSVFVNRYAEYYSIYVKDTLGCIVHKSFTLHQPKPFDTSSVILMTYTGGKNVSCFNMADGKITVIPTGGVPKYHIELYDTVEKHNYYSSSGIFTSLKAHTYSVSMRDTNSCSITPFLETLNAPFPLIIDTVVICKKKNGDNISCHGSSDGKITIRTSGGTFGHTVKVSNGAGYNQTHAIQSASDSAVFTGLSAGSYTVSVTDVNNCNTSKNISLTEPPLLSVTISPDSVINGYNIRCYDETTTATANPTGGAGGYTYHWSTNADSSVAKGLTAGNYSVTITDMNNCTATNSVNIIQPQLLQIVKIDSLKPHCAYSSDGEAIFKASGGVPFSSNLYFFTMLKGSTLLHSDTTAIADFNAGADIYNLTVTDKNNCWAKDSIHIINRDTLRVLVDSFSSPSCYGGNDGWIALHGQNGQLINGSDYIFKLCDSYMKLLKTDTVPIVRFDSLTARVYGYVVQDGFGCVDTGNIRIQDTTRMQMNPLSVPNRCYDDKKASLQVTATGGYGGYQFAYSYVGDSSGFAGAPDSTLLLNNLNWNVYNTEQQIKYIIYLRDKNYKPGQAACTVSDTFVLPPIKKIGFSNLIIKQPSCQGSKDGSIAVEGITGGSGEVNNWKFLWVKKFLPDSSSAGNDTLYGKTITGCGEGTYELTISDTADCSLSGTEVTLTDPAGLVLTKGTATPDSCPACDFGTGSITYTLGNLGNALGYSYSIDNGESIRVDGPCPPSLTKIFTGLHTGNHSLKVVTIPNGCTATDSFIIYHIPPELALLGYLPSAIGASNGSITVEASGGDGTYNYTWSDVKGTLLPINGPKARNLSKGTYSVYAVDGEGVTSNVITVNIVETDQLTIGIDSIKKATCLTSADGVIAVAVTGMNPPFAYRWTDTSGTVISLSASAINIPPGSYSVQVTDSVGSKAEASYTILALNSLSIIGSVTSEPLCYNGSDGFISISVTGGTGNYNIIWSTGDAGATLHNKPAGDYQVSVTDKKSGSCSVSKAFRLGQPSLLFIDSVRIKKPTCFMGSDGSAEIFLHGGSPGPGGYTFSWPTLNESGMIQTKLQAGNYPIQITDSHGCVLDSVISITNPPQIAITGITQKNPSCYGMADGKLSLIITNGRSPYLVRWPDISNNTQGPVQSDLHAGNYTVNITDANGCQLTDTVTLDETPSLVFDHFEYSLPKCYDSYDGSITAFMAGGTTPYSYSWSNGFKSALAGNIREGRYSVSVQDKNLCKIADTVTLAGPQALLLNVDSKQPSCFGYSNGQLNLTATGGTGSYVFACNNVPSGTQITNLPANTYTLTLTDQNGCRLDKSFKLSQPALLTSAYNIISPLKCNSDCNGIISLLVSGGTLPYSVVWPDNDTSFTRNNLCSGNYSLVFNDANGCSTDPTVILSQPDPLTLDSVATLLPSCSRGCNGEIHILPQGGTPPYVVSWANGQNGMAAYNLCAGTYQVTATDSNNCIYSSSFIMPDQQKVTISGISDLIRLCTGQEITLNPGDWSSYQWLSGETVISTQPEITIAQDGTYTLNVVSPKGCTDTKTFTVEFVKDLLKAGFLVSGDAIVGEEVEIIDVSWPIADSIRWVYNTDSITLLYSEPDRQHIIFNYPGNYPIKLVAQTAQCVDSTEQVITVYADTVEFDEGKRPVDTTEDIKELILFPNPNTGSFTVKITLNHLQRIILDIVKVAEGTFIANKILDGSSYYEETFSLTSQPPGVYSFNVTTQKEKQSFLFVILR